MTKRMEVAKAPAPLEEYLTHFDLLFGKRNQREGFRRYVEGLLLPSERHKTLTGLVNTEPLVGAQLPRVQTLQWFRIANLIGMSVRCKRSGCTYYVMIQQPRLPFKEFWSLMKQETAKMVDIPAHVARQYLGNRGKIDNGVVSVTSLWADSQVYYPVEIEPYTPESSLPKGRMILTFAPSSKSPYNWSNRLPRKGGLSVRWWLTPSTARIVV